MPDTAVMDAPAAASPAASPAPSPAPSAPDPATSAPSASTSGTRLAEAPDVSSGISNDPGWDEPSGNTPPAPKASPAPEPEPAAEPEPEPEAAPAAAREPEPAASQVELAPDDALEGIIEQTTREGRKQYVVPEEAYTQVHSAYQTMRRAEEILGEPLTEETLGELQGSRLLQAQLETDLISADPRSPMNVLDYLNRRGKSFREAGHVNHDPFTSLAKAMPDYLLQQASHDPAAAQAYQAQAELYMRAVLDNTYRAARDGKLPGLTAEQQQDVFKSTAWLDKVIFDKYSRPEDVPAVDPQAARVADIERREQALTQQATQSAGRQWNTEVTGLNTAIQQGTASQIARALAPVEKFYTDLKLTHPLNGLRQQLNGLVNDAIAKDEAWRTARNTLLQRAQHAPTAQLRAELLSQVQQRHDTKARLVLDPARNPKVKEILSQAAAAVASQSTVANSRKAAASQRREPTGAGSAPERSLMPPVKDKPGLWSADAVADDIRSAFN